VRRHTLKVGSRNGALLEVVGKFQRCGGHTGFLNCTVLLW
jgi:hypothetical protein